jgi:hypothetical protein
MTTTMLVCSRCGKSAEFNRALADGWLYAQRVDALEGYLVVRCPEHVTAHALRLAGLPQQKVSKRVSDNLDRGLWAEYGDGYIASAYESEDEASKMWYVLSCHKGQMPAFDADAFETIQALIQAMRKVEPDLRKWKLTEGR